MLNFSAHEAQKGCVKPQAYADIVHIPLQS